MPLEEKMKIVTQVLVTLAVLATVSFAGACNTDQNQIENQGNTVTVDEEGVYIALVDWADYYADIAELCRAADLIAYGEIDRVIEVHGTVGIGGHYYTDFGLSVSQALKGNATEEAIIHQMGASGKMVVIDDPLFQQGEKYVLFLHKCDSGVYYVLGGPQGRFKVVDDKVFSMDNIVPDEISVSPDLSYNGTELEDFLGIVSAEVE